VSGQRVEVVIVFWRHVRRFQKKSQHLPSYDIYWYSRYLRTILMLKKDYFWHIAHKPCEGMRGTSFIQKNCHFIAAQHFKRCSEAFADAEALVPCCRHQRHNVCGGFDATAHQRQHHASARPASAIAIAIAIASASQCQRQCQRHRQRQRYLQPQCQRHLQRLHRHICQQLNEICAALRSRSHQALSASVPAQATQCKCRGRRQSQQQRQLLF
jgi:hypothetical protein